MSSSRRPSRPVPRKARPRPLAAPSTDASEQAELEGDVTSPAPTASLSSSSTSSRPPTRSQNRAAKRASGVRPKNVRGGRVTGRPSRGYSPAVLGLAVAAVLVGAAVFAFGNPFGGPAASASASGAPTARPTPKGPPYGDGTCPTSQPPALPSGEKRVVTIQTSLGSIVIEVDGTLSPIAAGNFIALAACHYYDGIVFHRTAALQDGTPFVIQGGDPDGTGSGPGPGYTIKDEPVTVKYHRGTVAMARTQQADSQGSQFFIVLDDKAEPPLVAANTYAIFGEVTSGMDVADAIFAASAGQEIPSSPIVMVSVTMTGGPLPSATTTPASAGPTAPASAGPQSSGASPGPTVGAMQ